MIANSEQLMAQIQSIELQLAVLKAQFRQSGEKSPLKTGAALYGICAGLSDTTEEDLETAKYHLKCNEFDIFGFPGCSQRESGLDFQRYTNHSSGLIQVIW